MKKFARIEAGTVEEIFSTDKEISTLFHPSIEWVDITDLAVQPQAGWRYVDNAFTEPEHVNVLM
ncbi:hypothetical protein GJV08_11670 [Enterobacteriaceae bacterium RIT692]|nr:hypothetical protein [Enterobacteriaceae bacterium RIT692]